MAATLKSGVKNRGEEEVWWHREQGSEGRREVVHSCAGVSQQQKLQRRDERKLAVKQRRWEVAIEKREDYAEEKTLIGSKRINHKGTFVFSRNK